MKEKEKDIFDKIMALPGLNILKGFTRNIKRCSCIYFLEE